LWSTYIYMLKIFQHTHTYFRTHTHIPTHTLPLPPLKNHVLEHIYSCVQNTSTHTHIFHILHISPTHIFFSTLTHRHSPAYYFPHIGFTLVFQYAQAVIHPHIFPLIPSSAVSRTPPSPIPRVGLYLQKRPSCIDL